MQQSQIPKVTDILIIGGGLVGASLALALNANSQSEKLNLTLVESIENTSTAQPSFDDRSTVLSKSSANLFSEIGVWEAISPFTSPIKHIHTSDQGRMGLSRLHAEDYQLDAMGYVVDNKSLGQALYAKLQTYSNITRLIPATVARITPNDSYYDCEIVNSSTESVFYQARLVVLCDGGRSSIASQLGIHEYVKEYEQAALIANIELDRQHFGWTYERFTSQGPIAMLPLQSYQNAPRSALVWTTPLTDLERRLALSDSDFLQELQAQFGYRLGRFRTVGKRAFYPLKVQKVDELVRSRLAILGNAAHTLHPVAGQGFNLALRGAFLLANRVLSANEEGQDIGSYSVLNEYAQAQASDRDTIQQASDALISVFGSQNHVVGIARNLGILMLDNCPLLKREFVHSAMGLTVPKSTFRIS